MSELPIHPAGQSGAANRENKKGGSPEDARRGFDMENILQSRSAGNSEVPVSYRVSSESKKAGEAIDKLVEEAKLKGKPVSRIIQLTPVLAGVLLGRNPANRKLSERLVDTYEYEISGGRWVFNGEPIIVSDDGLLNDGQHRCEAVVRAGRGIEVVMIVGVSRTSRTTLDQGRVRTAGDYLSMDGHSNATALSAAANYGWQYRARGMLASGSTTRATKTEIMQFVADNPALERSLALFVNGLARKLGGVSFLTFCHFAIASEAKREDVDTFFLSLTEGANLRNGSPILYARNRLIAMAGGREQNQKAELVFKTWNAWRRGETVSRLLLAGGVLPVLEA